jgi:hypothetical protein
VLLRLAEARQLEKRFLCGLRPLLVHTALIRSDPAESAGRGFLFVCRGMYAVRNENSILDSLDSVWIAGGGNQTVSAPTRGFSTTANRQTQHTQPSNRKQHDKTGRQVCPRIPTRQSELHGSVATAACVPHTQTFAPTRENAGSEPVKEVVDKSADRRSECTEMA